MAKMIILGVEKCGTTSAEYELKKLGHKVKRIEWAYCFPGIRTKLKKKYPDYKIFILLRNAIDRAYSDYHYAIKQKQIKKIPYLQALKKYPRFAQGSAFGKWLEKSDTIIMMDELTEHKHKNTYRPMTKQEIQETQKAILSAYDVDYWRNYNEIEWHKTGVYFCYSDMIKGMIYQTLRKLKHKIK